MVGAALGRTAQTKRTSHFYKVRFLFFLVASVAIIARTTTTTTSSSSLGIVAAAATQQNTSETFLEEDPTDTFWFESNSITITNRTNTIDDVDDSSNKTIFVTTPFPGNRQHHMEPSVQTRDGQASGGGGGDFDDFNKLLEGAVVALPNARVENDVIILYLRNIRCTNFSVTAVVLSSETQQYSAHDTFAETHVTVNLQGLDMICYLDWTYTFIFTRSGSADLYSFRNAAAVRMDFQRQQLFAAANNNNNNNNNNEDDAYHPQQQPNQLAPAMTSVSVQQCDPQINVNDMDFRGDIAAVVLDTVEKLMRSKVEDEAEKRLCHELQTFCQTLLTDVLTQADAVLTEYADIDMDPLQAERDLIQLVDASSSSSSSSSKTIRLVDLREKSRATGHWMDRMLRYVVDFATKPVQDPRKASGNTDMNINVLIRETFLESDGALVLEAPNGGLEVFSDHNNFLNVRVVAEKVKIYGLDQINQFEPLKEVGKYTVQNKISWSLLTVELHVAIDIKASTKDNSVFVSSPPAASGAQEQIKITFGIQNVNVLLSLLLAVDETKLGALRLGSLLHSSKIMDCFLSAVHSVQVSGLALEAADIQPPVMEGFVARGIDRVVSDSFDAAFLIYESALLNAVPGFFDTMVRQALNEILEDYVRVDVTCFIPMVISASPSGFTDFRDLLLPPDQAFEAGGMGTEPYGDLPHTLVTEIKERFLSNDKSGTPRINTVIRDALGEKSNSNEYSVNGQPSDGVVIELGNLLNWNTTVSMSGLEVLLGVKVMNASIWNLDSFGSPLQLGEPVIGQANTLNNSVSIGIGQKPLRFTAHLAITATDYDGLQLNNEVAVQLDLGGARLFVALLLPILEDPLFSVPIEDTLNPNCWLATILPNAGDASAALLAGQSFSLEQLFLNITCVSCTSPDFSDLIYRLYSPQEIGNATAKVLNILALARESGFVRVSTDTIINGASKQCPHNSDYDPNYSYGSLLVESSGSEPTFGKEVRDENVVLFNVANAILSVLVVLAFYSVKSVAKRRYRFWRETLPDEALVRLSLRETKESERNEELNQNMQSMFRSNQLPRHVRFLVPVAIVATIAIQLVSHLAILSKVDIEGQIAGETFKIREFLVFKFIEAALRSYRNGGSEMAILLFVFTGIYPYIKLTACLVLWFLPPDRVSVTTRGSVLLWLDVFAKLSMVDILATLLAVAAFLVYVGGVAESELKTGEFFSTRVIIVPCAGFYCIVIAQRLTRISSTYLLNWHDHIVYSAKGFSRDWKKAHVSSRLTLSTLEASTEYAPSLSRDSPRALRASSPRLTQVSSDVCAASYEPTRRFDQTVNFDDAEEEYENDFVNSEGEISQGRSMVLMRPSVKQLVTDFDGRSWEQNESPRRDEELVDASQESLQPPMLPMLSPFSQSTMSDQELSEDSPKPSIKKLIENYDRQGQNESQVRDRSSPETTINPADLQRPRVKCASSNKADRLDQGRRSSSQSTSSDASKGLIDKLQSSKTKDSLKAPVVPSETNFQRFVRRFEEPDYEICSNNIEPNDEINLDQTYIGDEDLQSQYSGNALILRGQGDSVEQEENRMSAYWRRLALGMTIFTIFTLTVIGCILMPSISLDAQTIWGLFESGETFREVVSDYSIFRVICSVLIRARFVLDSVGGVVGLGILLGLAMISAVAFPVMRGYVSLCHWNEERKKAVAAGRGSEITKISFVDRLRQLPPVLSRRFQNAMYMMKQLPSVFRRLREWRLGETYTEIDGSDMDLLPEYRMKAWRHMEVYLTAFVIAIWQLGSAAAYVIHQYCWILEKSFETLVFLGAVESTSAQCFPAQASSPSTLLILSAAFLTLLASFLVEAVGQYRKAVSLVEQQILDDHLKKTPQVKTI